MESEDLAWLRAGEGEGHFHGPGAWPFGIEAYAGREDNDLILWLPSIGAIVTGDSLSDFGDGLDIWIGDRKHVTRHDVVQRLRPLLDLPVDSCCPHTASRRIARRSSTCSVSSASRTRGSCDVAAVAAEHGKARKVQAGALRESGRLHRGARRHRTVQRISSPVVLVALVVAASLATLAVTRRPTYNDLGPAGRARTSRSCPGCIAGRTNACLAWASVRECPLRNRAPSLSWRAGRNRAG